MGGRELVILLLGLAIIAVVLRGLYVAISARRGQIKLAIDKNIPRDVDLEAMELAELPGGGARVVERSLEQVNLQNNALEVANQRAEAFELGEVAEEADSIPVLMDAVELAGPNADEDSADEDSDDDDYLDEDPDSVLFDYGEEETTESAVKPVAVDSMQQVAPDYPEDFDDNGEDEESASDLEADESANLEQHSFSDDDEESETTGDNPAADNYSNFEDELDTPNPDGQPLDDLAAAADTDEQRRQPELGSLTDLEDEFDDFSMTAGERIGFDQVPGSPQVSASLSSAAAPDEDETENGLFDQADDGADAEPPPKRKSLFAAFARKPRAEREQRRAPAAIAEPELIQAPTAEVADAAIEHQLTTEPSEVIVLNVMAKEGYAFAGEALLHTLITAGLKFGEMNIFHQRFGNESKGPVIFSVANVLNPGTFDLNNMEEFSTLGISLFLALPTPVNNLEAFEQMLQVAQQIRGALDGELKDDNRNMMTAQTIEHYRQRVRDFELRMLKAAGGRA